MSPDEVCHSSLDYVVVHISLQELSARTLSEFLLDNEGKRCVVVLDVRTDSLPWQLNINCLTGD